MDFLEAINKIFEIEKNFIEGNKSEENIENIEISHFFKFVKDENSCQIINNIKKNIEDIKPIYMHNLFKKKNLDINDSYAGVSIMIFKSFTETSFDENEEYGYINSDKWIKNFIMLLKKYSIFFYNTDLEKPNEFRKEIFKIINSLIIQGIVIENKIIIDRKTIKNWKLNFKKSWENSFDSLNISNKPYEIIHISNKKYLKGSFFYNIYEIFRENINSGERFEFKKDEYLEFIRNSYFYIDKEDLKDVIEAIEKHENIEIKNIPSIIKNLEKNIETFKNQISNERNEKNKDYVNKMIEKYTTAYKENKNYKALIIHDYLIYYTKKNKRIYNEEEFINDNPEIIKTYEKMFNMSKNDINKEIRKLANKKKITSENINFSNNKKEDFNTESVIREIKTICEMLYKKKNSKITYNILKLDEIRILQSKIAKIKNIYNLHRLYEIINEKKIYFPFYFDFRGRFYYQSVVGPTNSKLIRYCINYGLYDWEKILDKKTNIIDEEIKKYNAYIEYAKNKYKVLKNNEKIDETIFWVLISIGKIVMNKEKESTSIEEFLKSSIEVIEDRVLMNDITEIIEKNHYIKLIKSLNEDKIKMRVILKDATASFIQNLIRIMGYKDEKSLKIANLLSKDTWYDTYSFILNRWIEKEKLKENELIKIFTRKSIKKAVMTNSYSATYLTAYQYFKEEVEKSNKIKITMGSKEEKLFKKFHNFIDKCMESEYFLKNRSIEIVNLIKEEYSSSEKAFILETDESRINLTYYKIILKSMDLIIFYPVRKRITKNYIEIDKKKIDFKAIKRSIRANWVHYMDALLVREINRKYINALISIHDCFLIDFLSISKFIINVNDEMNKEIFKELKWDNSKNETFFSIFIVV